MSLKEKIITSKLPCHVAVIMDGNGRWAKKRGLSRVLGHRNGVNAVRNLIEATAELGIKYLTIYAFSTENWTRPDNEVAALMDLMIQSLNDETETLIKNNIRLRSIGDNNRFANNVKERLVDTMNKTSVCTGLNLIVALSYSSRWEITNAAKQLAIDVKNGNVDFESIDEATFEKYLTTAGIPDPDLLIRTSGEARISNFLLWQMAYTEFYITNILWPDFGKEDFYKAIIDYQGRERRFGKTSEQIEDNKIL
jgi:undecaprenyl diphosphate synthase